MQSASRIGIGIAVPIPVVIDEGIGRIQRLHILQALHGRVGQRRGVISSLYATGVTFDSELPEKKRFGMAAYFLSRLRHR